MSVLRLGSPLWCMVDPWPGNLGRAVGPLKEVPSRQRGQRASEEGGLGWDPKAKTGPLRAEDSSWTGWEASEAGEGVGETPQGLSCGQGLERASLKGVWPPGVAVPVLGRERLVASWARCSREELSQRLQHRLPQGPSREFPGHPKNEPPQAFPCRSIDKESSRGLSSETGTPAGLHWCVCLSGPHAAQDTSLGQRWSRELFDVCGPCARLCQCHL